MDEDKKKVVMVVITILCIGLAAGITYWTNRGPSRKAKVDTKYYLKCLNPECGKVTEMDVEEFRERVEEVAPLGLVGPMDLNRIPFLCPHCGKKSCYLAEKCEKCGEVFVPKYDPQMKDYSDRCPKCGYSKIEEMRKAMGKSQN